MEVGPLDSFQQLADKPPYCRVGVSSSGAPWRLSKLGRFWEKAERGRTISQSTSWAFCFRSPCTCERNPMMEVPFFSFAFSLGISVSGLALALFRSKMISEG